MGARALAAAIVATLAMTSAHAQRREGKRATSDFEVRLPVCAKFGEVMVPPRLYRLTLGDKGFALANPTTMLFIATLPVVVTETDEAVDEPTVEVKHAGSRVEIVMRAGDRIYRAVGVATKEKETPHSSPVVLAGKFETTVDDGRPKEKTDTQLVARAAKRYLSGIKHCADKAHRNRWRTDDPRYYKCVCPIVMKWRLPRVKAAFVMHYPLSKGKSGFSIAVTPEGRVSSCRVWVGAKPPVEKVEKVEPTEKKKDAEETPPQKPEPKPAAP